MSSGEAGTESRDVETGPAGSPGTENQAVIQHQTLLRVRYSETDQMGTFYNSRALEWFECGRTELLRGLGVTYREMEARGLFLPVVEAHVEYRGRACYDDLLQITTTMRWAGRARVRLEVEIRQNDSGRCVVEGYTVHAFADRRGKALRPPGWFMTAVSAPRPLPGRL